MSYRSESLRHDWKLTPYKSLSELLYLPLPELPTASHKLDSIQIGSNAGGGLGGDDDVFIAGGKWEDEEERRFFEDIQDLKDFVPKSVLGVEEGEKAGGATEGGQDEEKAKREKESMEDEVRKLEEELERLNVVQEVAVNGKGGPTKQDNLEDEEDEDEAESVSSLFLMIVIADCPSIVSQHRFRERRRRAHVPRRRSWCPRVQLNC